MALTFKSKIDISLQHCIQKITEICYENNINTSTWESLLNLIIGVFLKKGKTTILAIQDEKKILKSAMLIWNDYYTCNQLL